jgi:phospho-N-acetylmuramoyl-pentapeptide-transferase
MLFLQWFTIVGSANAINLTDGQDGLAAGLVFLAAIPLALYAYASPQFSIAALFLSALCGALLAFLWYNAHPATVFMGDTGSLAIGGALGTIAIMSGGELLLGFVGFLFVLETLSVIVQVISYRYWGKRVFRCAPLHHHFEYAGLREEKVVVRMWIVGTILAILGVYSLL